MNYIFDLDGTLIDSSKDLCLSLNNAVSKLGLPAYSDADLKKFLNFDAKRNLMIKFGNRFETIYELWTEFYSEHCTDNVKLYSGVLDFLEKNSGKCSILTNKPSCQTLKILNMFNIKHHFAYILCGDTVPKPKPSPSGIFKIIKDSGWDSSEIIMVGDDVPDICASQLAGIKVATILAGFGETNEILKLKPDYIFNDFEEFLLSQL